MKLKELLDVTISRVKILIKRTNGDYNMILLDYTGDLQELKNAIWAVKLFEEKEVKRIMINNDWLEVSIEE